MKSLRDLYTQLNEKFESFWNGNLGSKINNDKVNEYLYKIREKTDLMPLLLTIFVVGLYIFLNPIEVSKPIHPITKHYNLTVIVYNFDKPLENATIILYKKNKEYDRKITDSNGTVVFNDIKSRKYLIVLNYLNITKNQTIDLKSDDKIEFQLELNKSNISLNDEIITVYYEDGMSVDQLDRVEIEFKDKIKKTFDSVSGKFNLNDLLHSTVYSIDDIKTIYLLKGSCSGTIIDPIHQHQVYLVCQNQK